MKTLLVSPDFRGQTGNLLIEISAHHLSSTPPVHSFCFPIYSRDMVCPTIPSPLGVEFRLASVEFEWGVLLDDLFHCFL